MLSRIVVALALMGVVCANSPAQRAAEMLSKMELKEKLTMMYVCLSSHNATHQF